MRRQLKRKDFRRDRDRKVKETRSIMNHMIRCAAGAAACLFLAAAAGQDIYRRQVSLFLPAAFLLPGLFCCFWRLAAEGGDLYMEAVALLPGCGLCLLAGLSDGKVGWGDGLCTLILGLLAGAGPCIFAVSAGLLLLSLLCVFLLALRKADRNSRMPFLPFLAAGYILYLLFD